MVFVPSVAFRCRILTVDLNVIKNLKCIGVFFVAKERNHIASSYCYEKKEKW
jgi:hypothetical protein